MARYPSDQWEDPEVTVAIGDVIGLSGNVTIDSGTITAVTDITNAVATKGNVTIDSGNVSLKGNVTTLIAGSTKTLVTEPIAFTLAGAGTATVFVGTARYRVTSLSVNTDSAVVLAFSSGPTYLAGNASLGYDVAANSTLIMNGTVDTPIFEAVTAADSFVLTSSAAGNLGGHITYYDE